MRRTVVITLLAIAAPATAEPSQTPPSQPFAIRFEAAIRFGANTSADWNAPEIGGNGPFIEVEAERASRAG